ncbi:MAG: RNA polymerase Rpb4 family protein [Candidatus Nezhaarchaeota archaeon]|nr:RNA polymerase Rpb4 family protein [Candidatus Nezhaarchaeota archaeon]
MRIREMREVTFAKAKEVLEGVKSKWGELKHFQQITLDYLTKFSKLPADKAEELVVKLCEQFKLSRAVAVQVVNVMPGSNEELRQILVKEGRVFLTEELDEIRKVLSRYLIEEQEQG